ncbi:MAG: protein kinase [Acidobacteriia bacterium]|nr:protein kinase [Terriglobia bacterium]
MPLSAGEKLGPYEILSPLGAGGMGEVYKARDTRLDRFVAIKVLPEHIAKREDLRQRFEREARAVASLNHPHICVLHDIGNQDGTGYMVLEYMEGETLAARITRGALPLDQALKFARQTGDALDRAHRAGVTHRDVKPANIMLTRDGVKVLDFGLAKSASKPGPAEETLTAALTLEGSVMGTPQYMAPEQFEGKEADTRSDIWAFGAVLYEMVTGEKAFQGKTYSSMLGAILSADPPPMSVKPFTPAALERLVRRCLAKDPEDRWQSMRDVVLDLEMPPPQAAEAPVRTKWWPWAAAAGLFLIVALTTAILTRPKQAQEAAPMQFEIMPPALDHIREVSVSPDGKMIAYQVAGGAARRLWLRPVDSVKARMVDEIGPTSVSWSPDGRAIAFLSGGDLKKMEITASSAQTIVNGATVSSGTAWGHGGYILFGPANGPIQKVRETGGALAPALELDKESGEFAQRFPVVLPDGEHVLYVSRRKDPLQDGVYLARLDGKERPRRVYRSIRSFQYVQPDTLLVEHTGGLAAVRFDADSKEPGDTVLLATELRVNAGGTPTFSASTDGRVIAYLTGTVHGEQLVLYDRTGKKLETLAGADPRETSHVEMSPDGKRLLLERGAANNTDLWTVDLGRKVVSKLTFNPASEGPGVWSADGQKVYFYTTRPESGPAIFEIPANGAGTEKLVAKTYTHHMHASPDGKYLMFERVRDTNAGLATLDLKNENKMAMYLEKAGLNSPQFSPDSRFVAYESSETGRTEVYVQTFPAGGGKWQISTNGGVEPRWRGDGKELIYDQGNGTLMAASVAVRNGSLEVADTKQLFRFRRTGSAGTAIAISQDAKIFAIREAAEEAQAVPVTVKLNWKLNAKTGSEK